MRKIKALSGGSSKILRRAFAAFPLRSSALSITITLQPPSDEVNLRNWPAERISSTGIVFLRRFVSVLTDRSKVIKSGCAPDAILRNTWFSAFNWRLGSDVSSKRPEEVLLFSSSSKTKRVIRNARVAFPTPLGPVISHACGMRPDCHIFRNLLSAYSWPIKLGFDRGIIPRSELLKLTYLRSRHWIMQSVLQLY